MAATGFRSPVYAYSPAPVPASASALHGSTEPHRMADAAATTTPARTSIYQQQQQHGSSSSSSSSSVVSQLLHARPRELVSHAHAHGNGVHELHRQWRLSLEHGAAAVPLGFLREVARDDRQVSADAGEAQLLGEAPLYEFICARCDGLTKRIEEIARRTSVTGVSSAAVLGTGAPGLQFGMRDNNENVPSKELIQLASSLSRSVAIARDLMDDPNVANTHSERNIALHVGSTSEKKKKMMIMLMKWKMAVRWAEACAWCMHLNLHGLRWRLGSASASAEGFSSYSQEAADNNDTNTNSDRNVDSLLISQWMTGDVKLKWALLTEETVGAALEVLLYSAQEGNSEDNYNNNDDDMDSDGPLTDSAYVVMLYYLRGSGASSDALKSLVTALGIKDSVVELATLCYTLDTSDPTKIKWHTVLASIQQKLKSTSESLQMRGHQELSALVKSLIARGHGETALLILRPTEHSFMLRTSVSSEMNDANLMSLQSCIAARLACNMIEDAMSFTIEVDDRCDQSHKATCASTMISQIAEHCSRTSDGLGRLLRVPFGPVEEVALRKWLDTRTCEGVDQKSHEIFKSKVLGTYCLLRGRYCEARHLRETNSDMDKVIQVTSSLLPGVQRTMEVVNYDDQICEAGHIQITNHANGSSQILKSKPLLMPTTMRSMTYLSPLMTPCPRPLLEAEMLFQQKETEPKDEFHIKMVAREEQTQHDGRGGFLGGVMGGIAQSNRKQNNYMKKRKANAFIV